MLKAFISLFVVATFLATGTNGQAYGRNIFIISSGPAGQCNPLNYYVGCFGVGYYHCCWGADPFCGTSFCDGCVPGDTIQAFEHDSNHYPNLSGCTDGFYAGCTNVDGNECCLDLRDQKTCQISFTPSFASRSLGAANATKRECTIVEPNVMSFEDEAGARYEIHLPKGTFETARLHFKDANWTALKSFSKWGESSSCYF